MASPGPGNSGILRLSASSGVAFPGFFRGLLDSGTADITPNTLVATYEVASAVAAAAQMESMAF